MGCRDCNGKGAVFIEGKVFDKWVVKSDTEGVKDSKVNISSDKKSSMNLLVEKCDCTAWLPFSLTT